MFENLLVAVNGSPCADRALELAVMLAKAEGSKLVICSVANPSALYGQPPAVVELALEQIRDDARHAVNQALGKARAAGVTAEGCLLDGGPAYEIVLYAGKIHADAIVIGTHGRSGLKRLFMGSVAEGVLRAAAMPVFTVRESQHMPFTPESVAMKAHILVPIDGSENALRALEVARDFAASLDAQLIVCHVVRSVEGGRAERRRGSARTGLPRGTAIRGRGDPRCCTRTRQRPGFVSNSGRSAGRRNRPPCCANWAGFRRNRKPRTHGTEPSSHGQRRRGSGAWRADSRAGGSFETPTRHVAWVARRTLLSQAHAFTC